MTPLPSQSAGTRRRLIDAAAELVGDRGWGGVSTRAVAEKAGVNPGVVHYHFASIDELRRRAVIETLGSLFDALIDASRDLPPRRILELTADAARGLGRTPMLLLFEAMPPTARDPQMRQELGDLLFRARRVLADRIRAYHPQPLGDPDVLAEVIAATLDGLLLHMLVEPEIDAQTHVRPLLALLGPEAAGPDRPEIVEDGTTR